MNRTITSPAARDLIRRSAGVELPAPGRWQLHPASFVAVTVDRGRRVRAAVLDGQLVLGDDGDPLVFELRTSDDRLLRLDATGEVAGDGGDGFAAWLLDGTVEDGSTTTQALSGALRYHGVYRHGPDAWAWLDGAATTRTRRRRRSGLDIVFDVIALPGG